MVRETRRGLFQQEVIAGRHRLLADEPQAAGGLDSGPGPYDLLLGRARCLHLDDGAALRRPQEPPADRTSVRLRHGRIYASDCADCETKEGMIDHIDRVITFEGDLDGEQRARLLEIADKCPVHRTLTSEIDIRTIEASSGNRLR